MRDFYRIGEQQRAVAQATAKAVAIEEEKRDIERTVEEELAATQAALKLSEQSRTAFLSSMNHELRTPLNAIMGFAEMMKTGVMGPINNETYANYVGHIHDSGKDLLTKISDLIDIANVDRGRLELDEDTLSVTPLLKEIIEIHSHEAFTKQMTLKLDCPAHIEILGDRTKILCALSHFVGNAVKHSNAKEDITITARVSNDDGLVLSVRDHGEGIAPSHLINIRAALNSPDCYLNIAAGGVGVGLALAKELAECHGGRIMLDSIRYKGTVVSLILPPERVLRGMPAKKRRSL